MNHIGMTVPQYRGHRCTINGRPVQLRPMMAELVALLLVSPPDRAADYETLVEALWPDPDLQPLAALNIIHVMVAKLRRQGVPIANEWGRGYFIPRTARGSRARRRTKHFCRRCHQRLAA